jgi:hypothetical protein
MPIITVSAEAYSLIQALTEGLDITTLVHDTTDNTYSFPIGHEVLSRLNTQRFADESTSDTIIRLAQYILRRVQ